MTSAPPIRWKFSIDPNYSWFGSFADDFRSPDVTFIPEYEDDRPTWYWFSSRHFTELDDPSEVRDRACALKAILDGAFYLNYSPVRNEIFHPFGLGELFSTSESGGPDVPQVGGLTSPNVLVAPFSSTWSSWVADWESFGNPFRRFESAMLWLSRTDATVLGMLQFLGVNGPTWITLYGLMDFMRTAGVGFKDMAQIGGTSQAEIGRFTGTANNFAAIGPFCRHGDQGNTPPKNPMLLAEAQVLVLRIARAFLVDRLNSTGLPRTYKPKARFVDDD